MGLGLALWARIAMASRAAESLTWLGGVLFGCGLTLWLIGDGAWHVYRWMLPLYRVFDGHVAAGMAVLWTATATVFVWTFRAAARTEAEAAASR